VNVASMIRSDYNIRLSNKITGSVPSDNQIAKEAVALITACKEAIKEGER